MIRDAVVHLFNEQPLVADLPATPVARDYALICTNLRTMNRQRPIFVDDSSSLFVIPFAQIRFVEIPRSTAAEPEAPAAMPVVTGEPGELELEEDFLRRVREL